MEKGGGKRILVFAHLDFKVGVPTGNRQGSGQAPHVTGSETLGQAPHVTGLPPGGWGNPHST